MGGINLDAPIPSGNSLRRGSYEGIDPLSARRGTRSTEGLSPDVRISPEGWYKDFDAHNEQVARLDDALSVIRAEGSGLDAPVPSGDSLRRGSYEGIDPLSARRGPRSTESLSPDVQISPEGWDRDIDEYNEQAAKLDEALRVVGAEGSGLDAPIPSGDSLRRGSYEGAGSLSARRSARSTESLSPDVQISPEGWYKDFDAHNEQAAKLDDALDMISEQRGEETMRMIMDILERSPQASLPSQRSDRSMDDTIWQLVNNNMGVA